jgi:outer membrane murein-binding lipoprotein Lpp
MEAQVNAAEAALQAQRAAHAAELDQLRSSVNALRLQLDAAHADAARALVSCEAQALREQDLLKDQIRLLRGQLEQQQ